MTDETDNLIEEAFAGVNIVACERCHGTGRVGLSTLSTTCPDCAGDGRTTNGVNLTTTNNRKD